MSTQKIRFATSSERIGVMSRAVTFRGFATEELGEERRGALWPLWAVAISLAFFPLSVHALDITGYDATTNDRFASGFPTVPVNNSSPTFVGADYDWSGVGWSTTTAAASSYKGFGFLSPQHYLVARHYGGSTAVRLLESDGTVVEGTQQSVSNLGFGAPLNGNPDLSIGTLTAPLSTMANVARYAVLDLYTTSTSTTYSVYNGLSLLAYGRSTTTNGSPRVGEATVLSAQLFDGADPTSASIFTARTGTPSVQLVVGDSGSPLLHGWTNPNGDTELTVLGLNSAIVTTTEGTELNLMSLLADAGAMASANNVMNGDGFALRTAGNPSAAWEGGGGGPTADNLTQGSNWSAGSVPTDLYATFNASTAGVLTPEVNGVTNLRGISFLSSGVASDGFTFSGGSTLTIGRGGVTNYDADRQTLTAAIQLGDSQYWDVGEGGITTGPIATAGHLLEVAGTGTAILGGAVSGTGGVAASGSRMEMTATNSYTGGTWVHSGLLVVNGSIATSSGLVVNAEGTLGGTGVVAAIEGSGTIAPGNSPGILTTPSVDPSGGLGFAFEFTQTGSPTWGTAAASGNDVLRLTDSVSPFAVTLDASNAIAVYLDVASLTLGDTFRGGFFTDRDADFLSSVQDATFTYYLASGTGSVDYNNVLYDPYNGPLSFEWSTVAESATFSGGTEAGFVSQFVAVPEPSTWVLLAGGSVLGAGVWVRRRRFAVGRDGVA